MAEVVFGAVRAPAIAGRDVLSLLLDEGAGISYLCMAGSCGTCRVRVCAGAQHLAPMTAAERFMLKDAGSDQRLACQAAVTGGGDVVVDQDFLTRPP
jgi:ferredoxin